MGTSMQGPDVLSLGVRVESSVDARMALWLADQVGTETVRITAWELASRRPPSPLNVARALGLERELEALAREAAGYASRLH